MDTLVPSRLLLSGIFFLILTTVLCYPCTTLLLPQSPDQIVAGNMDWSSGRGLIYINKRDEQKQAVLAGSTGTPLQWTSRYMSLTFNQTGREFPLEGVNEMGLSVTTLLFTSAQLVPSGALSDVNGLQWVQYILDTSATAAEAVANAQNVRINGVFPKEHYFVCDPTGACAAIEDKGLLAIHQGTSLPYAALTNTGYNASVSNLEILLSTQTPNQILSLPATDSLTRFAKAALLSSQYSPQIDTNDVTYAFSALSSVVESDTQWSIVFSLANRTVQYKTTVAPGIKLLNLELFSPQCSTGVQVLAANTQASGDVTSSFVQYTDALNNNSIQYNSQASGLSPTEVSTMESYPDTMTRCTEENVSLSSSPTSSTVGQAVVLTAQVNGSGSAKPTGTVTLKSGPVVLGTATVNSGGIAQLTTTVLPAGQDSLTAVYEGDASNPSITSPPLLQTVYSYSTQTSVVSSASPANTGQNITFTGAVTSSSSSMPTGTVTFSSNGTFMATVPLTNGQAFVTKAFYVSGNHLITATYSGDSEFQPSISLPLDENVN